ncbi:T9SS type A sorting domain-containing protein [bacterium]|nr:T9SS type A sorting domain-containing protein [bacterium]
MRKLVLFIALLLISPMIFSQWTQMTSEDLENCFTDNVIKHDGAWYFGGAGGVFKFNSVSKTWSNMNNNLHSALGRLNVENFTSNGTTLLGLNTWGGIVRTSDGGSTWGAADDDFSGLNANYGDYIVTLESKVFITAKVDGSNNIYYSDNSGTDWTKGAEIQTEANLYVIGDSLMVEQWGEIYYTTSDGVTLHDASANFVFPEGQRIEGLVRDGDYLYAAVDGAIWRYHMTNKDGWVDVSTSEIGSAGFIGLGGNSSGTLYSWALSESGIHFYKSTNGTTWTQSDPTLPFGLPFASGFYATGDEFMAAFIDAGMYYSDDAGDNIAVANVGSFSSDWETLIVNGDNLTTHSFLSGAYYSTDGGDNWNMGYSGLPDVDFKVLSGLIEYNSKTYANFTESPGESKTADPDKVYYTTKAGALWAEVTAPASVDGIKILGENNSYLFILAVSGTDTSYHITNNDGANYTNITANFPADFVPVKIVGDGTNTYMLGFNINTDIPELYLSVNNGDSWTDDTPTSTSNLMSIAEYDDQNLLLAPEIAKAFVSLRFENYDDKLFRRNKSNDGWDEVNHIGLDYLDLECIQYADDILYVSQWGGGILASFDDGDKFENISDNLPSGLGVEAITVDNGEVYISSNGQGLWYNTIPIATLMNASKKHIVGPNPVRSVLTIPNQTSSVSILSLTGKVVKEIQTTGKSSIDVSDLNGGVYLFTFNSSKGNQTFKIVKK